MRRLQKVHHEKSEGNPALPASVSIQEPPVCAHYPGVHSRSATGDFKTPIGYRRGAEGTAPLYQSLNQTVMKTLSIVPQIMVIVKVFVASFFLYRDVSSHQFHNRSTVSAFDASLRRI